MKQKNKNNPVLWNEHQTNIIVGLVGIVLILLAIIIGTEKRLSVVMLSVGTSILASAIVSVLNSHYLIRQFNANQMVEHWGIDGIYEARAQINIETNELLKNIKSLEICAMGLKEFRDAQAKVVERRVSEGMHLKILTIDPKSSILSKVDQTEKKKRGATKSDIESLIKWVTELKKIQLAEGQVEIRTYDHYPYDFYFCMDGVVFTGPYQAKASQQTITYKYLANSLGANMFKDYFDARWEENECVE